MKSGVLAKTEIDSTKTLWPQTTERMVVIGCQDQYYGAFSVIYGFAGASWRAVWSETFLHFAGGYRGVTACAPENMLTTAVRFPDLLRRYIVIFCTLLMDTSELLHSRKHAYAVFIPITGVWLQIFCTLLMGRSELLRSKKQLACCGYASFQTRYNDVLCGYIDTFTFCW